jgi:hypothetical protein
LLRGLKLDPAAERLLAEFQAESGPRKDTENGKQSGP